MNKVINHLVSLTYVLLISLNLNSQTTKIPELKRNFNEEGSCYVKASIVGQFWSRYTEFNPGSTVDGFEQKSAIDFAIRRLRFNVWSQLTDRIFLYSQFGQNNFSYTSKLYTGSFFHDAVAEFKVFPTTLSFGTGLTGWSGLTRFSAPSAGSILGVDAPLYQQVTNGITDQFLRKLSVYAKGKLGKLDYRLVLSKPMLASNSSVNIGKLNPETSTYSLKPPKLQSQGYLNYQFLDQENNTLGYMAGTYHGTKKILNLGAGWIQQNEAMWRLNEMGDTLNDNLLLLGADLFMELPLSEKKNCISAYLAFTDYHLGKNYVRNLGVLNPANGVNSLSSFNGAGDAFPILGTGQTFFIQIAYKFKDDLLKKTGTFQIYSQCQLAKLQGLSENVNTYEGGINWLISGDHKSKITIAYQSRPIFSAIERTEISRKGMLILQFQIGIL